MFNVKGLLRAILERKPINTRAYWEDRYRSGADSGAGSYGKFAHFKAEVINAFIVKHGVSTVIEFGCGDGNQFMSLVCSNYIGLDISSVAIARCKALSIPKGRVCKFLEIPEYQGESAELSLSLDVVFHIIEDDLFLSYLDLLFKAATKYVIIYSSNTNDVIYPVSRHVRHRKFTDVIDHKFTNWRLIEIIPNRYPYSGNHTHGSFSDFYIFHKIAH